MPSCPGARAERIVREPYAIRESADVTFSERPCDAHRRRVPRHDTPDGKAELVRGELRMNPASHIPLVWLIDPRTRAVMIIEDDQSVRHLTQRDVVAGGGVVPDFSCAIAELFVGIA
jgi:hypothetical protein